MMRVEAFRQLSGFNPSLIAGQKPELCIRLRRSGWRMLRIDADMTLHDMAMTWFGRWWKRSERTGHAYAEGSALYGNPPERHWVRETRSTVFWGIALPLAISVLAWPTRGLSLVLLGGYLLLYRRTRRHYAVQRAWPTADARLYAGWIILAKFPQAVGLMRYWRGRLVRKRSAVMEYKGADGASR